MQPGNVCFLTGFRGHMVTPADGSNEPYTGQAGASQVCRTEWPFHVLPHWLFRRVLRIVCFPDPFTL